MIKIRSTYSSIYLTILMHSTFFSCSVIVENILQKQDSTVNNDAEELDDSKEEFPEIRNDINNDTEIPLPDLNFEIFPNCFEMEQINQINETCPKQTVLCSNGTINCKEKCDETNKINGDECDPACYFKTEMCTLARPFSNPSDIAVDGNLIYVADKDDHTIKVIDINNNMVGILAGYPKNSGNADGEGMSARFNSPSGIEIMSFNTKKYLIVTDTGNHKVKKINISTSMVETIAGTGEEDSTDGSCLNGAKFNSPWGIATDGINIYVTDSGSGKIRVVESPLVNSNCLVKTIGESDSPLFHEPKGITVDSHDPFNPVLYVTDSAKQYIVKISNISSSNPVFDIFAGQPNGTGNCETYTGVGCNCNEAGFDQPTGIDFNGEVLIVAETNRHLLREIIFSDSGCTVTILAGNDNSPDCYLKAESGNAARIYSPSCIAFDKNPLNQEGPYRLFFCDSGCNAIKIIK